MGDNSTLTTQLPTVTGANHSVSEGSAAGNDSSVAAISTSSLVNAVTDVLNTTLVSITSTTSPVTEGVTEVTSQGSRSIKDHTTFVALIVMGVIVPAIFITVIVLICRQRRKDLLARRTQMLLQNTQDFVLEDYTSLDKATCPPPKV